MYQYTMFLINAQRRATADDSSPIVDQIGSYRLIKAICILAYGSNAFNQSCLVSRFKDLSKRNAWLSNAKHLKGYEPHISISPDIPPVLRPIRNELLLKRKALPVEQKKRSYIRYLRQWPYMDLVAGGRTVSPDARREDVVSSVLGVDLSLNIQEPDE